MKHRTFYHISLLLPYFALVVSGAITFLVGGFDAFSNTPDPGFNFFTGTAIFFTVSAIVWGPLYTWMVVVMLIWGRGRSTEDVRHMYLLSPVLLGCSTGILVLIIDPLNSGKFLLAGILNMNNMGFAVPVLLNNMNREASLGIGISWLFAAMICMVIGYVFVGFVLWLERALMKRGILQG